MHFFHFSYFRDFLLVFPRVLLVAFTGGFCLNCGSCQLHCPCRASGLSLSACSTLDGRTRTRFTFWHTVLRNRFMALSVRNQQCGFNFSSNSKTRKVYRRPRVQSPGRDRECAVPLMRGWRALTKPTYLFLFLAPLSFQHLS